MKNRLLAVLSIAVCLYACEPRKPQRSIELQVENAHGRSIALFEIDAERGALLVDSVRVRKRKAVFSIPAGGPHVYALLTATAKTPLVLVSMNGERLRLQTDYDSTVACARLMNDSLAPVNAAWLGWQQRILNAEKSLKQIEDTWLEQRYRERNADSLHLACSLKIQSISDSLKQEARKLCMENIHSLLPILIANKNAGQHPLFDFSNAEDLHFLSLCADSILTQYPENSHAKRFRFQTARAQSRLKQAEIPHR